MLGSHFSEVNASYYSLSHGCPRQSTFLAEPKCKRHQKPRSPCAQKCFLRSLDGFSICKIGSVEEGQDNIAVERCWAWASSRAVLPEILKLEIVLGSACAWGKACL